MNFIEYESEEFKEIWELAEYEDLFPMICEDAENGNPDAMYYLGEMYFWGKGGQLDSSAAIQLYLKAAESGNIEAMKTICFIVECGLAPKADISTVLKWVIKAAEADNVIAISTLGSIYEYGQGVAMDKSIALNWYLKGAEKGNASCMEGVARIYAGSKEGHEYLKDSKKAEEWFRKAEQSARTEDELGFDYSAYYTFLDNEGREKDAFDVMKRGANKGDKQSMEDLGSVYYYGEKYGVSKNMEEAAKWFLKAAHVGDSYALRMWSEIKRIQS